jgi:hypothetical protein
LGVQWRAWGSASVGWVPDDTGFISSFFAYSANHWVRQILLRHLTEQYIANLIERFGGEV